MTSVATTQSEVNTPLALNLAGSTGLRTVGIDPLPLTFCETLIFVTTVQANIKGRPLNWRRCRTLGRHYTVCAFIEHKLATIELPTADLKAGKDMLKTMPVALIGNRYRRNQLKRCLVDGRTLMFDGDAGPERYLAVLDGCLVLVADTISWQTKGSCRLFIPLLEPLSPVEMDALYAYISDATGDSDSHLHLIGYPPAALLGGPRPRVRFRDGRLLDGRALLRTVAPRHLEREEGKTAVATRPQVVRTGLAKAVHENYRAMCREIGVDFRGWRHLALCFLPGHKEEHPDMLHVPGKRPTDMPVALDKGHKAKDGRAAQPGSMATLATPYLGKLRRLYRAKHGREPMTLVLKRGHTGLSRLLLGCLCWQVSPSSLPQMLPSFDAWASTNLKVRTALDEKDQGPIRAGRA